MDSIAEIITGEAAKEFPGMSNPGKLSDEDVNRIAEALVEKAMEDVGIRDIMIGSAMGKGAIPLYGRETRKAPCSCCLIDSEGPNIPENRMCTTKSAIGTLKDSEEREWCSEIKIVSDGRCTRARGIREAARECKEKHPEDTEAFFRCYIPAFSQATRESNPGKEPWQMTEAEFAREALRETFPTATFGGKPLSQLTDVEILATADAYFIKSDLTQDHKYFVEKALSEGKPVPPEVLRDYPDLVRGGNPGRKEPWQMTEDEFVSIYLERFKHMLSKAALAQVTPEELQKKKEEAIDYQKHTIKQALARGELVPPEVLADYPSLLKGAK